MPLDEVLEVVKKSPEEIYRFAYFNQHRLEFEEIRLLEGALMQKDTTGEYCKYFAEDIKRADTETLLRKAEEKQQVKEEQKINSINVSIPDLTASENAFTIDR